MLHLLYFITNIMDAETIANVSTSGQVLKMPTPEYLKVKFKNEFMTKRAELELSQEKMAECLNISLRSYSNLEHGKYCCSLTTFINYVNNFDVDKDKLFSELAELLKHADE